MPTVKRGSIPAPWASPKKEPFQKEGWRTALYQSARWKKLRLIELVSEPKCAACWAKGILTTDNLQRDHINGFATEQEFWDSPRQTLCKLCNIKKAGRAGRAKQMAIHPAGLIP